ncbi:hypothetical protein JXD20_03390 [Candidatus Peregrinibacteria bacterium]|nr:hypothetical protein [Candidatus Peregrinibacteria bacterium]
MAFSGEKKETMVLISGPRNVKEVMEALAHLRSDTDQLIAKMPMLQVHRGKVIFVVHHEGSNLSIDLYPDEKEEILFREYPWFYTVDIGTGAVTEKSAYFNGVIQQAREQAKRVLRFKKETFALDSGTDEGEFTWTKDVTEEV